MITASFVQGGTVSASTDLTVTSADLEHSQELVEGTAVVFLTSSEGASRELIVDGRTRLTPANQGISLELSAGRHRFVSSDGRHIVIAILRANHTYTLQAVSDGHLVLRAR